MARRIRLRITRLTTPTTRLNRQARLIRTQASGVVIRARMTVQVLGDRTILGRLTHGARQTLVEAGVQIAHQVHGAATNNS